MRTSLQQYVQLVLQHEGPWALFREALELTREKFLAWRPSELPEPLQ